MKDIFDLRRFGFLLKKTVMERPLQILGSFGLTLLLTWIAYITQKDTSWEWASFQRVAFGFGLILGGGYLAATIFAYFSENSKGFSYLTLPASQFEKWLCGLLIMTVFTALLHVFFRFLDTIYVTQFHNNLDPKLSNYKELYRFASVLPFDDRPLFFVYKTYFNLIGFMAVSAFYFNKNAVIKGALLFFGLFMAGMVLNGLIAKFFFSSNTRITSTRPFLHVYAKGTFSTMPENWLQLIDLFFLIGLPTILWLVALIRLREKEF